MMIYETEDAFRKALERRLGKLDDRRYESLVSGKLGYEPYGDGDLEEVLRGVRHVRSKRDRKTLPEVVAAIADEVVLWQEIRLASVSVQVEEGRRRLFGAPEPLDQGRASEYLSNLFSSKRCLRPVYANLLMDRRISSGDFSPYLQEMKPNDQEYFYAMVAMVMNAGFLSGAEAMSYLLTGAWEIQPGLFNPSSVMMAHRLLFYLQPPGRPARSLLSAKERALVQLAGPKEGACNVDEIWMAWNREHTEWRYKDWRTFWKAYQRAKTRLLDAYQIAFWYEDMQDKDRNGFWQKLREIHKRTKDGRQV